MSDKIEVNEKTFNALCKAAFKDLMIDYKQVYQVSIWDDGVIRFGLKDFDCNRILLRFVRRGKA